MYGGKLMDNRPDLEKVSDVCIIGIFSLVAFVVVAFVVSALIGVLL